MAIHFKLVFYCVAWILFLKKYIYSHFGIKITILSQLFACNIYLGSLNLPSTFNERTHCHHLQLLVSCIRSDFLFKVHNLVKVLHENKKFEK